MTKSVAVVSPASRVGRSASRAIMEFARSEPIVRENSEPQGGKAPPPMVCTSAGFHDNPAHRSVLEVRDQLGATQPLALDDPLIEG
jgi:hypothetical protein